MRKLIAYTLAGLMAVIGLAGLTAYNAYSTTQTSADVADLGRVRVEASIIRLSMVGMSNAMRGYLLDTANTEELKAKDASDEGLVAAVERLKTATTDPEILKLADAIGALDEAELDPMEDRVLEAAATSAVEAKRIYFERYMPIRERQMAVVDALDRAASDRADSRMAQAQSDAAGQVWMAVVTGVLVVALLAWSVWTTIAVSRQLAGASLTLSETADGVLRTSREVGRASQSLSQGATAQAGSIEETSASMEEMSSMTRKTAENSRDAAVLMGDVDARVHASNRALDEMVGSMTSIQDASRQVARIIKTIDEIAFQTNILALNAAVEAARAGEAGMGFAVVADEVRTLAQRSAQAARDTAALIDASLARTEAGAEAVQQVAHAIGSITESVSKVRGLVDEVSAASQQQSQGIEQVTRAIAQMETVTQTTAATAEESAASSEQLSGESERALALVEQLKAIVGSREAKHEALAGEGRAGRRVAHAGDAATSGDRSIDNVVRMPVRKPQSPAERAIPFGEDETGTFGRF